MKLKSFEEFICESNNKITLDMMNNDVKIIDDLTVGDLKKCYDTLDKYKFMAKKTSLICINDIRPTKEDDVMSMFRKTYMNGNFYFNLYGYVIVADIWNTYKQWDNFSIREYEDNLHITDYNHLKQSLQEEYPLKKQDFFKENKDIKPVLNEIMNLDDSISVVRTEKDTNIVEIENNKGYLYLSIFKDGDGYYNIAYNYSDEKMEFEGRKGKMNISTLKKRIEFFI